MIQLQTGGSTFLQCNTKGNSEIIQTKHKKLTWLTKCRASMELVELDGMLYALGGTNNSDTYQIVEKYNPITDRWSIDTPMSTARSSFGAAANQVYKPLK